MKNILLPIAAAILVSSCGVAAVERPASFSASAPTGLVVLQTRVAPGPQIPEPVVEFVPYDSVAKQIEGRGRDLPGSPFRVGRGAGLLSNAGNQQWEGWVLPLEPGTYVVARATNPNSGGASNTFARGTMMFEVKPGEAVYLGDFSFYLDDYRSPTAGQIAGDFLKAFFSLGLLMPNQRFYGGDVTFDDARARSLLTQGTNTSVHLNRTSINYVNFEDGSRRAWFLNPLP